MCVGLVGWVPRGGSGGGGRGLHTYFSIIILNNNQRGMQKWQNDWPKGASA